MENLKNAKRNLRDTADMAKSQFSKDLPMIRQIINDSIDNLVSEYKLDGQQENELCDYAGLLHPKSAISRRDYMNHSGCLHHEFYSQFITQSTFSFILASLSVEDIARALEEGDEHLNEMKIPYNNMGRGGSWWWDAAPINVKLLKELGGSNSPSTHTCVAKAAAKILVEKSKISEDGKI